MHPFIRIGHNSTYFLADKQLLLGKSRDWSMMWINVDRRFFFISSSPSSRYLSACSFSVPLSLSLSLSFLSGEHSSQGWAMSWPPVSLDSTAQQCWLTPQHRQTDGLNVLPSTARYHQNTHSVRERKKWQRKEWNETKDDSNDTFWDERRLKRDILRRVWTAVARWCDSRLFFSHDGRPGVLWPFALVDSNMRSNMLPNVVGVPGWCVRMRRQLLTSAS